MSIKSLLIYCVVMVLVGCQPYQPIKMNVKSESLVLSKTNPSNFAFDNLIKGSLVVRSTYVSGEGKSLTYIEGQDYVVNYGKGTISRTKNSNIPDFSKHVTYGLKDIDHKIYEYSVLLNHEFYIWCDYTTSNGESWAQPNDQTEFLTKTREKLEKGGVFTIVFYGDSITNGQEASSTNRQFKTMYSNFLQQKFPKTKIKVIDATIPGFSSGEGIAWFDEYMANTNPDLVLIGWGMNDHTIKGTPPKKFQENLVDLVNKIKMKKGADVILYSSASPNDKWKYGTHRMGSYAKATKKAAEETGSAYVNVYDTWMLALKRKDYPSLLNNNINHPNDFGHFLYEQAFEAMTF